MIKINKDDSIIDIIRKINNCKEKEIVLDFPFWHQILHNYTSLKILKSKAWKKDLILITSDKTAKNIWKNLWIKYSQIWDTDLLEYNYTFFEYLKYMIKRYFLEFKQLFWNKTPDFFHEYKKKYSSQNSNIWIFLLWLLVSVTLFLFIFYFAVNKTYIEITPEISVKTKSENFIFREAKESDVVSDQIIKLIKVEKLVYLTENFWTSWVSEEWLKNSKWKVRFYNHMNEEVELLQNTRLETKNGVLYTTDTQVMIPKATASSTWWTIPWTIDINITSKIHDSKWNISWNRVNIWSWVLLTLPWLKDNKSKIYANTLTDIKWWSENFTRILTKEDIDNAKVLLEWKLKQQALNILKKQIKDDNLNNNITYDLLWIDWILKYSDFKILWDDKLKVWEKTDKFELSGTIKISSYKYNTEKVISQMSTTIKWFLMEDIEKLKFVNNESLRIADVIYKQDHPFEIKATAQIEAFFSHNFSSDNNTYVDKLKTSILWLSKSEAVKVLMNSSKISDAKIEVRPFFIKNVSKIPENIVISVNEK